MAQVTLDDKSNHGRRDTTMIATEQEKIGKLYVKNGPGPETPGGRTAVAVERPALGFSVAGVTGFSHFSVL